MRLIKTEEENKCGVRSMYQKPEVSRFSSHGAVSHDSLGIIPNARTVTHDCSNIFPLLDLASLGHGTLRWVSSSTKVR